MQYFTLQTENSSFHCSRRRRILRVRTQEGWRKGEAFRKRENSGEKDSGEVGSEDGTQGKEDSGEGESEEGGFGEKEDSR